MNYLRVMLGTAVILVLSACAPINTQFSCNETAGDKCLSIEEVHAMTERHVDKDVPLSGDCTTCNRKQAIWLAPWKDKNGRVHQDEMTFVG